MSNKRPMQDPLPAGWVMKESRSNKGKFYYWNAELQKTQWERPMASRKVANIEKVRASHILVKHRDSRRPSSWKSPTITRTKEEAKKILQGYIDQLKALTGEELKKKFADIAKTSSDCSSAARGGDLGSFTFEKMQKPFSQASFALTVGTISDIVDTDSGVHVILRTE